MQSFFAPNNMLQVLTATVFILYLVVGYHTPHPVAQVVDTVYGKIIVVSLAIALFLRCHPILGVLGFLVAFDLIMRSSAAAKVMLTSQSGTTETQRSDVMNHLNAESENPIRYPNSLEQDVIRKMAPLINSTHPISPNAVSFNPVLNDLHDASPLNFDGIGA